VSEHTQWVVSSSVIVCEKETGRMVANCLPALGVPGLSFGIEEASAHATLIAASPTMYSICERLADTTNMETVYSLQEEARAIISKKEETDV